MTMVLAVDDSASMRQMLAHALHAAGYEVAQAVDGIDALDKLEALAVDVVITDQNMPRMDGLTLTRALRADPRWQRLPVLVLTTETGDALKQEGRAAGATGWLGKPFDPRRLVEVLAKVAPQPTVDLPRWPLISISPSSTRSSSKRPPTTSTVRAVAAQPGRRRAGRGDAARHLPLRALGQGRRGHLRLRRRGRADACDGDAAGPPAPPRAAADHGDDRHAAAGRRPAARLLARHQAGGGEAPDTTALLQALQAHMDGAPAKPPVAAPQRCRGARPPRAGAAANGALRDLEVLAGPLDPPSIADDLVELFGEVTGGGSLDRVPALPGQAAGRAALPPEDHRQRCRPAGPVQLPPGPRAHPARALAGRRRRHGALSARPPWPKLPTNPRPTAPAARRCGSDGRRTRAGRRLAPSAPRPPMEPRRCACRSTRSTS
jgi:two-component system chemotaxis response regulator CheY